MDFWGTVLVVYRRWYIALPVFLLSLFAAAAMYAAAPIRYFSSATILLTTPPTGGTEYADGNRPTATNPLLLYNDGLNLTGAMLIQAMRTTEFRSRIGAPMDGTSTLEVNNGTENPELLMNGPFVFLKVDSTTPKEAQELVRRAVSAARVELRQRQATLGTPASTYITFTEVVPPTAAQGGRGSGSRAAAAALGLGLITSVTLAFAAESALHTQKRLRARRSAAAGLPIEPQPRPVAVCTADYATGYAEPTKPHHHIPAAVPSGRDG